MSEAVALQHHSEMAVTLNTKITLKLQSWVVHQVQASYLP